MKYTIFYTDPYQPHLNVVRVLPREFYKNVATIECVDLNDVFTQVSFTP
jgi:hypothetical protein